MADIYEKGRSIIEACKKETSRDPFEIFFHVAADPSVPMHGPEHHILDGACVLTAFCNAGGKTDLNEALERLLQEGVKMPGAACGLWGVCGAVTSIGAALAIIDGTGPLSTDGTWGWHMQYTSDALRSLAGIGGPRCCKRDAFLAIKTVIPYINEKYHVTLEDSEVVCTFSEINKQCLQEKCPFHKKNVRSGMVFEVKDCDDYEVAKKLIREYSQIKGAESCFVTLEKELADLGAFYQGGAFLIGYENGQPVATIAIRRIDERSCEAKRLYIKPECRGKGYARILMNAMLERCRALGFEEVTFTTKPAVMSIGYGLYQRMGFEETGNTEGTVSMKMTLV